MPRTGSLLSAGERAAFAEWLKAAVDGSGKSRSAIAAAMGADTTSRLNVYLAGKDGEPPKHFPTLSITLELAKILDQPRVTALLVAGYYREVIGVIDLITRSDDFPQNVKDDFIHAALFAFPRGGSAVPLSEQLRAAPLITALSGIADESFEMAASLVHHPMLKRAVAVLADRAVRPLVRRRIAAEYVHEWALDIAPHMYEQPSAAPKLEKGYLALEFAKRGIKSRNSAASPARVRTREKSKRKLKGSEK